METSRNISKTYHLGLQKLGFKENINVFLTNSQNRNYPIELFFHLEDAAKIGAQAICVKQQLNGSYKPQLYFFDLTARNVDTVSETEISEIQKKIWTSGEVPIACIILNTELKIIDCSRHINDNDSPTYLLETLKLIGETHKIYNEEFALKIESGLFWGAEEMQHKFKFKNSSYDKLIENIRFVSKCIKESLKKVPNELINKIIVQSILIKYLEERIDTNGNKLLSQKYFKKFKGSTTYNEVLRNGKFVELLSDLHNPKTGFNGNVFYWSLEEQEILKSIDLSLVADLLDTKIEDLSSEQLELGFPNWRYFEFKFIPVELISRLYEEFLGEDKREKGLYYTPSHLAKLLIEESIPLNQYKSIDVLNFRILDPACGSGIFLVIAFKRLVQIWRLQNDMKTPSLAILKKLLKNVFGIDKENQAIRLASFSLCLALCNELNPLKIINKLKFDDLVNFTLIPEDFFQSKSIGNKKFDLIIGNPPFKVGAIKGDLTKWTLSNSKIQIPQNQIALKFLVETLPKENESGLLKKDGIVCLIIKSSGLLYNSTSRKLKSKLFSSYNIVQILDFTALARNKSLWDNGADVASAAIFIRNSEIDLSKNILHLTFRRTKATKERIVFEIDTYDLHYVNRNEAVNNEHIWKINLLGGGRIKSLVNKFKKNNFEYFLKATNSDCEEGFEKGTNGKWSPNFIFQYKTLPTDAISEGHLDFSKLENISRNQKFSKVPKKHFFEGPNILIKENIGKESIPIFLNERNFTFQRNIISIKNDDKKVLETIFSSFKKYNEFYRFYIYATSGQLLINKNTVFLKKDILNLPFIKNLKSSVLSSIDKKVIHDVNSTMQDFLRHGERSIALKPMKGRKFNRILNLYSKEFVGILNLIYQEKEKQFKLVQTVKLKDSFIACIFKYTKGVETISHINNLQDSNLSQLLNLDINESIRANRILIFYPRKDTIIIIKPNQIRYWIPLIAYRDADKCIADLTNAGY